MARTINPSQSNNDSSLNAMLASILLLMGLSLILMFIFTRRDQPEIEITVPPTSTVDASAQERAALNRLSWEEERLERLQQDYANVNAQQANVEQINSRIENLTAQAQTLQQQIAENQIQLGQTYESIAEQQSQMLMEKNAAQINFENRLQQLRNEQIYLQARSSNPTPAAPTATPTVSSNTNPEQNPDGTMTATTNATVDATTNATVNPVVNASLSPSSSATAAVAATPVNTNVGLINELEVQKNQVASAMRVNKLETQNQIIASKNALQATRSEMMTAREELQLELKDANEELKYWQSQKTQSGNEQLRLERLALLQRQINEQLNVVKKLSANP